MFFRDLAIYALLLCAAFSAINAELQAIGGLKHQAAIIAGHMIGAGINFFSDRAPRRFSGARGRK